MVKLKTQTNLVRRQPSGVYYFRARVPKDLVSVIGKEVIFDSLKTKDKQEAVARAAARRHEIQQELARVQARTSLPAGAVRRLFLADEEIQDICQSYKATWLAQDEEMRRAGMSDFSADVYSDIIQSYQDQVVRAVRRGDVAFIADNLRKHLRKLGIDVDEGAEAYRRLAFAILTTEAELNHARMAREAGRAVETPKVDHSDVTLDNVVDYWAVQTNAQPRTRRAFQGVFDELKRQNVGVSARALRKSHLVKFRDALHEQGQSPKTIDKKLSFIRAAFAVALDSDLVEVNPVVGVKPPRDKRTEKPRLPFTDEDLSILFSSPVYATGFRPKGGAGEAAYWLPLVALFSGARLEELAQLRVGDLIETPGYGFYMSITDEGEGNQLKTRNARRRVPVHPELLELGFLDYWESCREAKQEFVFPHLKPDVTGKRSGNWSKWFSRYKRDIGIKDGRKVFHSFRHGFIDACRAASIATEIRDVLVGHANSSVAAEYGQGLYPLPPLFDAIKRIRYEGLDLKKLLDRREAI